MRELTFEEINLVSSGLTWTEVAAGLTVASAGMAVGGYWTGGVTPVGSFLLAGAAITGLTAAGINFAMSLGYRSRS